jgi:membrane dipeptidase
MERREFVKTAALAGASAGLVVDVPALSAAQVGAGPLAGRQSTRLLIDGLSPSGLSTEYIDMLLEAGVTGWHKSMGGLQSFADAYDFLDGEDRVVVATRASHIERAKADGKVALMFGWQTSTPLGDKSGQQFFMGSVVPADRTELRAYYQLGLRIANLTYNTVNAFGAGCLEPHLGITRAGRRLVEEIHGMGMILDLGGHTGYQTSMDALEMSSGVPVVCSHTNVAALLDNPRNTRNEVFEGIAATGGVIGLSAINDFVARSRSDAATRVTPQVDLPVLLDHYDYLRDLVGVDHIGVGADFTHGNNTPIDPDNVIFGREMASEQGPIFYVRGFEDITEIGNLEQGLGDRGWSESDLDKVLGGNWMRVYEQVWGD